MLFESYTIKRIMPCLADPEKIRVIAEVRGEIHKAFPFLNARVKGCIYNHPALTLTIKTGGKLVTLHPYHITLAKIEDEKEAESILSWLKDLVNSTYEMREQIEPDYSMTEDLKAIDVYKLLPAINCGKCGERSCLAFAVKLASREMDAGRCSPLFSPEYGEKRKILFELLEASDYDVPASGR